jgi:hypothetical protein
MRFRGAPGGESDPYGTSPVVGHTKGPLLPWLSEEIPNWDDLSDDERESLREAVRALGLEFPDPNDDDYYE